MIVTAFVGALARAEADLLEVSWPEGRNPASPWDGDHFRLPGMERPLSVSATEARFLANFVSLLDCQSLLEIGTGFGYSAAWMALGLSMCTSPRAIYTVDNSTEGRLGERGVDIAHELWRRTGVAHLVKMVRGTSPQILDELGDLRVELAFIDGEHRGQQPLMDYQAAQELLTHNGCIVFHDVQEKYNVKAAVKAAETDGFACIPLNTSCEPVVAVRSSQHQALVLTALTLARRRLLIGSDNYADGH